MIKRVFSIVLTVISLFTLVLPVSAQAENGVTEPEYYAAQISVNNKDAWGDHVGKWYYKTWTGKAITPKVKVWFSGDYLENGNSIQVIKELTNGQDYKLTLGNNTDMGYCRLNITGIGKYSDVDIVKKARDTSYESMTEEDFDLIIGTDYTKGPIFVIRPLGTKLNKVKGQKKAVKVTWKKQAKKMSVKRITGYQIQFSTRKDFKGNTKNVTVKGYKNTSKTVKKLKAKKKYYVRVRTYFQCKDGFKSYSTWSKAKTVKTK